MTRVLKKYGDGIIGLGILAILIGYMAATPKDAKAAVQSYEWKTFPTTCSYTTATRIDTGWSQNARTMYCTLAEADATDCVCLGGSDVNNTTKCQPIGGCARAPTATFSWDGDNIYCLAEDGLADATLVCTAGK